MLERNSYQRKAVALSAGRPVLTADGHRIGSLKQVHGNYLEVDSPMHRDYWLSCDDVEAVRDDTVVMAFDETHAAEHRFDALPEDADASVSLPGPVILDGEAQQRERETMEREIAEQARTLDASALHPRHAVPGALPAGDPASERVRGETLPLADLMAHRGCRLVDASGDDIGEIVEIYFDEATERPEWIGADVPGALGVRRVVAPVWGSHVSSGHISVPYTRSQVMDSPAGNIVISAQREAALYEHYGLPYSRDVSSSGLPLGMTASAESPERAARTRQPGAPPAGPAHDASRDADEALRDTATEIAARPTPAQPGDAIPPLPDDAGPATAGADIAARSAPHLERPPDERARFAGVVACAAAGALALALLAVRRHRRHVHSQR